MDCKKKRWCNTCCFLRERLYVQIVQQKTCTFHLLYMLSLSNSKKQGRSGDSQCRREGQSPNWLSSFFLRCSEEMLFAVCITDTAALSHLLLYQNTVLFHIFCYLGFQKASATVSVELRNSFQKNCFSPHQLIKTNGFTPRFTNLRLWKRNSPLWFLNMVWRLKQEQWVS